jgi:hypothetical protein
MRKIKPKSEYKMKPELEPKPGSLRPLKGEAIEETKIELEYEG